MSFTFLSYLASTEMRLRLMILSVVFLGFGFVGFTQPTGQSGIYFRIMDSTSQEPIFSEADAKTMRKHPRKYKTNRYQVLDLSEGVHGIESILDDGTISVGTFWYEDHHFAIVRDQQDTFYLSFLRFPPHYYFVQVDFTKGKLQLDGEALERSRSEEIRKVYSNGSSDVTDLIPQMKTKDQYFTAKHFNRLMESLNFNPTDFQLTMNTYEFDLKMDGVYNGEISGKCRYDSDSTRLCQVNEGFWFSRINQIQEQRFNEEPDPSLDQHPNSFMLHIKKGSQADITNMEFRNHNGKKMIFKREQMAEINQTYLSYRYTMDPKEEIGAIYLWVTLKEEEEVKKMDIQFKDVITLFVYHPHRMGSKLLLEKKDSAVRFFNPYYNIPMEQLKFKEN